MVDRKSKTVAEYLAKLPPDRRKTISTVRTVLKKNLPKGYVESMNWGGICYEVPLKTYPETYNGQPLAYAGLASQKNYCSLYLMCCYASSPTYTRLKEAFAKAGKKLDMGKCCMRFKNVDDLPLAEIGKIIASVSVKKFIQIYETARNGR